MSPSIISHVSIGTNHFPSAIAFWDESTAGGSAPEA